MVITICYSEDNTDARPFLCAVLFCEHVYVRARSCTGDRDHLLCACVILEGDGGGEIQLSRSTDQICEVHFSIYAQLKHRLLRFISKREIHPPPLSVRLVGILTKVTLGNRIEINEKPSKQMNA